MSDKDNIFNESNIDPAAVVNTPNPDNSYADLLASIQGEGGVAKYKDVPTALAALKASQEHIARLERERADQETKLRESTDGAAKQAELERTVQELIRKQQEARPTGEAALTPEQIADMVNRTLARNTAEQSAKTNAKSVATTLKAQFGDKAEELYNAAAEENGFTVAEFNALAQKSPKAVLKMLGVSGDAARSANISPVTSSVNTSGFKPNQETFVKRNTELKKIGATTEDQVSEFSKSKRMVEELHAQGLSVHDLSDPKTFRKYFGQ